MSSTAAKFQIILEGEVHSPEGAPLGLVEVSDTLLGVLEDVANSTTDVEGFRTRAVSAIVNQITEQLGENYPLTGGVVVVDDRTVYARTYPGSLESELFGLVHERGAPPREYAEKNFWRDLAVRFRNDLIAVAEQALDEHPGGFDPATQNNTDHFVEVVAKAPTVLQRSSEIVQVFLEAIRYGLTVEE